MAFPVSENIKLKRAKKKTVAQAVKETIPTIVKESAEVSVNFLFLWTAVFWYYFFSGLTLLIRGKLPRGWHKLEKKEVANIISTVGQYTTQRADQKKYGKVVDLDNPRPDIDII